MLVGVSFPEVSLQTQTEWKGDYKGLAQQVLKAQSEHTIMLIKSVPEMPDILRNMLITDTYTGAFVVSQQKNDPKTGVNLVDKDIN